MLRIAISMPDSNPPRFAPSRYEARGTADPHRSRPPVRTPRQCRDDRLRAGRFFIICLLCRSARRAKARRAGQHLAAAWRVAHSGRPWLGTGNRHRGKVRLTVGLSVRFAMDGSIEQVFLIRKRLCGEVHLDQAQARLDRHAESQRIGHFLVAIVGAIAPPAPPPRARANSGPPMVPVQTWTLSRLT